MLAAGLPALAQAAPYVDRRVDALSVRDLRSAPLPALLDARRQLAGRRLQGSRDAFFVLSALSQGATFAVLWRTGRAARLRDAWRRRTRRTARLRFVYATSLALLGAGAALPVFVVRHHVQRVYGLERTGLLPVLLAACGEATLAAIAIGAASALVLAIVDRTRVWYAQAAIGVCALTVAAAILPAALALGVTRPYRPPLAMRTPLVRLASAAHGLPPLVTTRTSARIEVVGAKAVGIGPMTRIVLGPTLVHDATPPEIVYEIARIRARLAHGDALRLACAGGGLLVVAIGFAVFVVERLRVRPGDDALSRLSIVFAWTIAGAVLLLPGYRAYERRLAAAADATALRWTGDPVAATRFLVRVADERMTPACPVSVVDALVMPVPWPAQRIAAVRGETDPCSPSRPQAAPR